MMNQMMFYTIFSECLAHENHPNFLRTLGHQPQLKVILILSTGLESNSQKTLCQNLRLPLGVLQENIRNFRKGFAYYSKDHLTNLT